MASNKPNKARRTESFRVGRVHAYLRGRTWYLRYQEQGSRRQPRVGVDREAAKRTAAEINAQLAAGSPSALGFEPATIAEVRQRWLEHHEHVRRSSLNTIRRYRAATDHLLNFIAASRPGRRISDFTTTHATDFVRYLRLLDISPNGHPNSRKRRLLDSGVKYILETCSSLFSYARRQRHLSP